MTQQTTDARPGRLAIWTFDWAPDGPRGFVRDLRLRWALDRHDALARYVDRACGRPALAKAHSDQMAHFAAADVARSPA